MKIVIEIPEEEYEAIKSNTRPLYYAEHLIKNGTPLKAQEPTTTVQAIPLAKVKKARKEMESEVFESLDDAGNDWFTADKVWECMAILDKLITD